MGKICGIDTAEACKDKEENGKHLSCEKKFALGSDS